LGETARDTGALELFHQVVEIRDPHD
jgi:hypothetical protein